MAPSVGLGKRWPGVSFRPRRCGGAAARGASSTLSPPPATTVKASRSEFVRVRGIDLHCRVWGPAGAPRLVLLHGSQDVSASWQFTVDALSDDWEVVAPDWRGNGLSGWSGADAYWYPDYLGDLDALLERWSPERPVRLVGHSMGAGIGALYAGIRPERVARFVNVDGFGAPAGRQDPAPRRFAKWLAQLGDDTSQRPYSSFEEFALRMQSENPRLTGERALFLAHHWGREEADGSVVRRADPALKRINPLPLPQEDVIDCWRQTQASVLWIDGAQSGLWARLASDPRAFEERAGAYADLRIEHVEDAGHNVHHDQPERLATLIEAFMR
jgi:pimeloyl-ACP methyl ester carboxylesterase